MITITIPVDQDARQWLFDNAEMDKYGHRWNYPEVIVHPVDYERELGSFLSYHFGNCEIVTMNEVILAWIRVYVCEHRTSARIQYIYSDGQSEWMDIDSEGRCEYYDPCMRQYELALRRLMHRS